MGTTRRLTEAQAEELFNDYIRGDWKRNFQAGGEWFVAQANGARYVPNAGSRRLPAMA